MKLLRSFTLIAALAGASTVYAETAKAPAPAADKKAPDKAPAAGAGDKKDAGQEISAAEADEFLKFFNKFVDAIVANKDNCEKMAGAINSVIDANMALVKKANEAKAAGKKLPKKLETEMMSSVKNMMPGMQKCGSDKKVQDALKRMDDKKDAKADAKPADKAPEKPATPATPPAKK
jgi:hypothetical protein